MKIICKYTLEIVAEQEIDLPFTGQLLSLQPQHTIAEGLPLQEKPQLWILHNKEAVMVKTKVICFVTEDEIPVEMEDYLIYLGTVKMKQDTEVYHFFKLNK